MKLLFCLLCKDVRKLAQGSGTWCSCGESWGRYLEDGLDAELGGPWALCLGLDNNTLRAGLLTRKRTDELGPDVRAWIFPESYSRVTRRKDVPICEKQ